MRLEFKRIITMIVKNIMLVGEVFQIEVSDGLVHPLGSHQNVNVYPAVVGHEFSGVCMRLELKRIKTVLKRPAVKDISRKSPCEVCLQINKVIRLKNYNI